MLRALHFYPDQWQSVFPSRNAEFSHLHDSIQDAYEYIQGQVGNVPVIINIIKSAD